MSRRLCDSACAWLHLSWLTAQFMIINLQSGTACLSLLIYICWPLFSVLVSDLIKEKHYADGSDCVLVGQAARWERLERLARWAHPISTPTHTTVLSDCGHQTGGLNTACHTSLCDPVVEMSQLRNYKGNIPYLVYPVYCLPALRDPVHKGGGGRTGNVLLGLPDEVGDGDDPRHGGVCG